MTTGACRRGTRGFRSLSFGEAMLGEARGVDRPHERDGVECAGPHELPKCTQPTTWCSGTKIVIRQRLATLSERANTAYDQTA